MFTAPGQTPPISYPYPYRIKRKPVPSLDLDSRYYAETDLKDPIVCSSTAFTRSSVEVTSDFPRLPYVYRKPAPLHTLPPLFPHHAMAEDIPPSPSKKRHSLDLNMHSVDVALIRDTSTMERRHSSECHVEPHYHKRAQSMLVAAPFQAALSSNQSIPSPPYAYSHLRFDATRSKILYPSPTLKITREDIPPIDTDTTHDPVVNISSSQNHASGRRGSRSLSFISPHIQTPSLTQPKELKVSWLSRPISMSLGVGAADDLKSKSRCHLTTRRCSGNPTPTLSRPPPKRNVLRASRRRTLSLSSAATTTTMMDSDPPTPPPAMLGVDAELENLSQQKALAPALSPQPTIESSNTFTARQQTTPGHAKLRRRTSSHYQQHVRPTTAPAASYAPVEESRKPTRRQLSEAASLVVIASSGVRVSFGDLFLARKTVVIFIRHFWCVSNSCRFLIL